MRWQRRMPISSMFFQQPVVKASPGGLLAVIRNLLFHFFLRFSHSWFGQSLAEYGRELRSNSIPPLAQIVK
jgi:hypothetical protein